MGIICLICCSRFIRNLQFSVNSVPYHTRRPRWVRCPEAPVSVVSPSPNCCCRTASRSTSHRTSSRHRRQPYRIDKWLLIRYITRARYAVHVIVLSGKLPSCNTLKDLFGEVYDAWKCGNVPINCVWLMCAPEAGLIDN